MCPDCSLTHNHAKVHDFLPVFVFSCTFSLATLLVACLQMASLLKRPCFCRRSFKCVFIRHTGPVFYVFADAHTVNCLPFHRSFVLSFCRSIALSFLCSIVLTSTHKMPVFFTGEIHINYCGKQLLKKLSSFQRHIITFALISIMNCNGT